MTGTTLFFECPPLRAARICGIAIIAACFCVGVDPWPMMRAGAERPSVPTQTEDGWPAYGGQPAQDHYSSLAQINRKNVKNLRVAWTFDTGEKGSIESTPVIVGRMLYTYTPSLKVVALDASTGKLI